MTAVEALAALGALPFCSIKIVTIEGAGWCAAANWLDGPPDGLIATSTTSTEAAIIMLADRASRHVFEPRYRQPTIFFLQDEPRYVAF